MARVDPDDDSIKRYIVRFYAFDPSRHERRHQEIAAFDGKREAFACLGAGQVMQVLRRQLGSADPREYLTMIVKEPGAAERSRLRRLEEKRRR
jgi:hypothetical protein